MTSYTRRAFLKLCTLALPGLTILSKIPLPKPFNTLNAKFKVRERYGRKAHDLAISAARTREKMAAKAFNDAFSYPANSADWTAIFGHERT